MDKCRAKLIVLPLIALMLTGRSATATDEPDLGRCTWSGFPREYDPAARSLREVDLDTLPTQLDALEVTSDPVEVVLKGKARLQRGDQSLEATHMVFNRETKVLSAEEQVRFDQNEFTVISEHGSYDIDRDYTRLSDVEYYFYPRHAQGNAERAEVFRKERAQFQDVTYSTCNPDQEFWSLHAGKLELDRESGRGTARDAVLRIKDVPVLYTPYISFPIDDRRKSGLLFPTVGDSDRHGFDVTQPWYWNIAPDRDATFFPRYMAKRGLMLGAEFRYLNPTNRGELFGTYLPHDREYSDDDRWALFYEHQGQLAENLPRWRTDILFERVSDDEYITDFSDSLRASSVAFLQQRADLSYAGRRWRSLMRVQTFQTVDPAITSTSEPYELLPKLQLSGNWPRQALGMRYHFDGELTNFNHEAKVDGERLHLQPGVSLPMRRPWGNLTPKLSLWYSGYSLRNNDISDNDMPSVAAPVFSLDSRLIFERPVRFGDMSMTQTLEPSLFYLYVPYKSQDDLPNFDTADISANFTALFQENRFVGKDRIGDANQVTAAVTTRLLDQGRERMLLGLGQIFYFRDLEVTLDDEPFTRGYSDLFAVARAEFSNQLSMQASVQWDPQEHVTQTGRLDLRYNPARGRLFNFSYRFERGDLEQSDISAMWPISSNWTTLGRWNYSFEYNRTLEALVGVEYHSCCWAVRIAGRHWRDTPEDDSTDNAIYVELELKGLAGLGFDVRDRFGQSVVGYDQNRYR